MSTTYPLPDQKASQMFGAQFQHPRQLPDTDEVHQSSRWFASVSLMDKDIEQAARILAATAGSPVRVILFGSHARGDAHDRSDLDFLVIEPEVSDRHAEMVRLRTALHNMRRPIDVLVYSVAQVEEWGDAPGTTLHAALSEGRTLVEA